MKHKVEKKLFSLMTGELFAAIMFAFLWVVYIPFFDWSAEYLTSFPTIFVFSLLEFILLQGTFYWFIKWKKLKQHHNNHLSLRQRRLFVVFKRINIVLFLVGFIVFWLYVFPMSSISYILFFVFLYSFALIEYINYFHIRLSYMSIDEMKEFSRQKGFRKSILAKELKREKIK